MPITTNEGGVLYELDTVTANEGGTLYELDTVHSNEGGVLYEIYSGAFGNGANDTLDWLAQYPEKAYLTPSSNGFSLAACADVSQAFYTSGYIRLKSGQTITLDAQSSAYLSGGHSVQLAICDKAVKEKDESDPYTIMINYTQITDALTCEDTLLHTTSLTVEKSGWYFIKLVYRTLSTSNRIKATLSFSK